MATTSTLTDSRVDDIIVNETAVTNTAINDIAGGATTLYGLQIVNGVSGILYLKLYDANSATASDTPDIIIEVQASATKNYSIPDGLAFATGLSARCVQEDGTGGTTSPAGGNVAATFIMS